MAEEKLASKKLVELAEKTASEKERLRITQIDNKQAAEQNKEFEEKLKKLEVEGGLLKDNADRIERQVQDELSKKEELEAQIEELEKGLAKINKQRFEEEDKQILIGK